MVSPSGYLSKSILLQSIGCDFDRLFLDECAHPSLVDAAYQVSNQYEIKIYKDKVEFEKGSKRWAQHPQEQPTDVWAKVWAKKG